MLGRGGTVEMVVRPVGGELSSLLLIDAGGYPAGVLVPVDGDRDEFVLETNYGAVGEGVRGLEGVEGYEWTHIHVLSSCPTAVRYVRLAV